MEGREYGRAGPVLKQNWSINRSSNHQLVAGTKKKYGVFNHEIAYYLLANEHGINLKKYVDPDKLLEVQKAIQTGLKIIINENGKRKMNPPRPLIMNFGKDFTVDHPILSKKLAVEAQEMSKIYPLFYVFENSVKNFIGTVMRKAHGDNWWESKTSSKIREKVDKRMKDDAKHKWHGKRGAHPIFYTDIEDLGNIINTNWEDFKEFFTDQAWVMTTIGIMDKTRNIIAHNNPLERDDIDSIRVFFRHWTKQLRDFKTD